RPSLYIHYNRLKRTHERGRSLGAGHGGKGGASKGAGLLADGRVDDRSESVKVVQVVLGELLVGGHHERASLHSLSVVGGEGGGLSEEGDGCVSLQSGAHVLRRESGCKFTRSSRLQLGSRGCDLVRARGRGIHRTRLLALVVVGSLLVVLSVVEIVGNGDVGRLGLCPTTVSSLLLATVSTGWRARRKQSRSRVVVR
ncbi:hypothetical protein PENTCL1PPCAC_1695, partial [Pristionchus entomophagus]